MAPWRPTGTLETVFPGAKGGIPFNETEGFSFISQGTLKGIGTFGGPRGLLGTAKGGIWETTFFGPGKKAFGAREGSPISPLGEFTQGVLAFPGYFPHLLSPELNRKGNSWGNHQKGSLYGAAGLWPIGWEARNFTLGWAH